MPAVAAVTPSVSQARVESLTGLRWFAAMAVLAFHLGQRYHLPVVQSIIGFGDAGVTFFYVLSGFVLTWSFREGIGVRAFYWRRFARIWPMLALTTLFAWLAFAESGWVAWRQTLLSLTMVEAWVKPPPTLVANPVAWSISTEAFFYLAFPFVVGHFLRASLRTLGLLAVGCVALDWSYWVTVRSLVRLDEHGRYLSWIQRFPPYRMLEFLLGVAVAAALLRGWRPRLNFNLALAAVPVSVAVLLWGNWHHWWISHWSQPGLLPACVLVVLAAALRDLRGERSLLRSRPLVALGAWSYGLYLIHLSVLELVQHRFVRWLGWPSWVQIAVIVVVATALSGAAYRWFERPVEAWLRAHYPSRIDRLGRLGRIWLPGRRANWPVESLANSQESSSKG